MSPAPMIPMRMVFSLCCLRGGVSLPWCQRAESRSGSPANSDPGGNRSRSDGRSLCRSHSSMNVPAGPRFSSGVAFHLMGPAGRIGERQLPHPGRAPAQPEDLTEFLLTLLQVGDRDPDVPDASHDEPLSGRFVRYYGSSMRTGRPLIG